VVIEAAQVACNIAPGSLRHFAFEKYLPFQAHVWAAIREEAQSRVVRPEPGQPALIYGSDVAFRMVDFARRNAERAGVAEVIVEQCRTFYDTLQSDQPPPLDDTVPCYEAVKALHPDIDGSTVDVEHFDAVVALAADIAHKDAERALRGAKTRLLDAMGNAATAMCNGIKVADRRPHAKGGVALALATRNLTQLDQETP
jgi:hypothetical protein